MDQVLVEAGGLDGELLFEDQEPVLEEFEEVVVEVEFLEFVFLVYSFEFVLMLLEDVGDQSRPGFELSNY